AGRAGFQRHGGALVAGIGKSLRDRRVPNRCTISHAAGDAQLAGARHGRRSLMNPTLSYLLGRRMWWVPGVAVWGQIADFEPEVILSQVDGASKRIVHGKFAIGGSSQT